MEYEDQKMIYLDELLKFVDFPKRHVGDVVLIPNGIIKSIFGGEYKLAYRIVIMKFCRTHWCSVELLNTDLRTTNDAFKVTIMDPDRYDRYHFAVDANGDLKYRKYADGKWTAYFDRMSYWDGASGTVMMRPVPN
jgi:hypothetical protein